MRAKKMTWRPAPGWPEPPPGWQPPADWTPPADWPPAPADWQFWVPQQAAGSTRLEVRYVTPTRRGLVVETWLVMLAVLVPWVISAIVTLGLHLATGRSLSQLPSLDPHQPAVNIVLGVLSYLPVVAVAPLALLLLARTGQPPSSLGLRRVGWPDAGAGVGLAAAAIGCEFVVAVALGPLLQHSGLANTAGPLHVPAYYLVFGLTEALLTAIAEETAVNAYLLTRLDQLGWSPASAFWLSLGLRTSYHAYYGIAAVLTLPFGYFMTRSFQKHRKLSRPIMAHFLYDSAIFLIAVLR